MKRYQEQLVVMALEIESNGIMEKNGYNPLYTGVGKIQAAVALTKELQHRESVLAPFPSLVINFGTAGSKKVPKGSLIACTTFVQRDMLAQGLGVQKYVTPFSEFNKPFLKFKSPEEYDDDDGLVFDGLYCICGSGDNFVDEGTWIENWPFTVVDMEAYSLAHVCHEFNIPFISFKYISDSGSKDEWLDNCHKGAQLLINVLKR